ncbi:PLP-dependent transferase [Schizopora paradoxa]|uniref:cystathionine gamma-synthase n=1 Tax=Schizopora paradoxa TaxID=27342 RepID=A0A0H2RE81_9AGAM|nr:PLP-dependent transferase [Schizopora paradoxa]
MAIAITPVEVLGSPVPAHTSHAISVSLPKWKDNVDYEKGEKRVMDAMVNGYPRFFIHRTIEKLAGVCERKFGRSGERCLLFPSAKTADYCREFIERRSPDHTKPFIGRVTQFIICPEDINCDANKVSPNETCVELYVILFAKDAYPIARQFWQHTGMGISSRLAERCLTMLREEQPTPAASPTALTGNFPAKAYHNRHYSSKIARSPPPNYVDEGRLETDEPEECDSYLEERYGRNLPTNYADAAKRTLRRRIAGVLIHDSGSETLPSSPNPTSPAEVGPSSRIQNLTESDVYLFSTGMTAIWNAHNLALNYPSASAKGKSVCFGFPYADTLKVLEKWGPGCNFFGHGLDSDIDAFEELLSKQKTSGEPSILALFTEFPSNPLLRSPDLPRLRKLADEHDFLIVVDETVGNFVNVSVLQHADIVVSSLTKVFSGDSNVMGGSLVLNPNGHHYASLKATLDTVYEDTYYYEDAVFLERNSRVFKKRIQTIDENAEAICDFLFSEKSKGAVIKEVYYPKFTTRANFEKSRSAPSADSPNPGFGGLFSVTFNSKEASEAFFDSLEVQKGPSLGTSFTLACPFVVLAHFAELEWAAGYGVEENLVRVSVGGEDKQDLLRIFEAALRAAERAK